jgi:drug/metabolite transporter (DMT)-like permease
MKNILLFIVPTLIWGSTWYVIKFQVGDVDPMLSVSYRFLLAGVIMLLIARCLNLPLSFSKTEHGFILLQGVLIFGINYWLFYISELYLTSGLVGLIFSLLVIFNIVNARIFLKNELDVKVIAGGILGLMGTVLVFWDDLKIFSWEDGKLLGITLAIGGTLIASLGNITSARNTKAGIPVISCNAYGMTYGGLTMMLIALISGKNLTFAVTTEYIASLAYLTIFGSIIAFGAYLTLVGTIGASKAAYVSLITPVIALLLSTFLEDYTWSAVTIVGVLFILIGNTIALFRSNQIPSNE